MFAKTVAASANQAPFGLLHDSSPAYLHLARRVSAWPGSYRNMLRTRVGRIDECVCIVIMHRAVALHLECAIRRRGRCAVRLTVGLVFAALALTVFTFAASALVVLTLTTRGARIMHEVVEAVGRHRREHRPVAYKPQLFRMLIFMREFVV